MSRRIDTIGVALISICFLWNAGLAQIPNAGFENWTGIDPTGWATSNAPPVYTNVTQSTVAHGGSLAVRGDVVLIPPVAIGPAIQSGPGGHGFAYNQRPTSFTYSRETLGKYFGYAWKAFRGVKPELKQENL